MNDDDALLVDVYELTMLQALLREGERRTAAFELFSRKLPRGRAFLVPAGLEQALDYLESFRFSPKAIERLARLGIFRRELLDALANLRFTGDVDAVPEGTPVFPDEPWLRVVAPMPEAQIVETRLLNLLHFETIVASKAARCVLAAPGKQLVEFGLRRAHGAEAGLLASRAAYLAGFDGTSNLLATLRFGVPPFGTMAHSYVMAHASERDAFLSFARANPERTTFLVDTWDTERAAQIVAEMAPALAAEGIAIGGVRLDSGDLAAHARAVRAILDAAGLGEAKIFATGGLDEHDLARLAAAPIDGFGVGTRLCTSADAPSLDCAYKLVEHAGRPVCKRSEGKRTWPGRKQVFRAFDPRGDMRADTIVLEGRRAPGEPLLRPVMRGGLRLAPAESLAVIRERAIEQLGCLPPELRELDADAAYPVTIADELRALADVASRSG